MIRVCHLITGLEVGGAELMLARLIAHRNARIVSHKVVSLTAPGEVATQIEAAGVEVTTLGMKRGQPNLLALARLLAFLRREKPDILQTWLYHADLMGLVASFFRQSGQLVWNIRCSDMVAVDGPASLRAITKILAWGSNRPQAVIVNSRSGCDSHRESGYRPRYWMEIPNGVDTEKFKPRRAERFALKEALGLPVDARVIGLAARFHPMKDFANFLEGAARLAARRSDVVFALVGSGTEVGSGKLSEMIGAVELDNRIYRLGNRRDMENVYPAFDLVTLSSAYGEGCPNVLLEAMACGVPCVATNVGDCSRIIANTGRSVPARDPVALADAWEAMIENDLLEVGAAARARAVELFDIRRVVAVYEDFYTALVRGDLSPKERFSLSVEPPTGTGRAA